jgi:Galactose oxidase-like, Early set domain/Kelch motif/Galactose oxidase, central domain
MAADVLRRTLLSLGLAGALAVTAAVDPASAAPGGPGSWSGIIDWSNEQIPNSTLKGFVAVHLAVGPAGDVLMWDREDGLTSARRWDPSTGAFTNAANAALPTALFCAFQTRLPGDKLIVVGGTALKKGAGGSELAGTGLDQARIYDWATGAWSTAASMHTPRWYPTVVALPDGRQVVMGGQVKKGVMATLSEVYNPANNTWTELPGLAELKTLGTYPRAILAPNGKIFMIKNGSGKSAFMDVDTQTWTVVGKSPPAPGGGGMAMYDNGKILIFGVSSNASDSYVIDLNAAKPAWRKVGSLHFPRKKFSTVILPDGRVMAIGGSSDGQPLDSHAVMTPEIWDPTTELWSTLPDIAVPRMYHSNALLLPSGQVLNAGGGRAPGWTDEPSAQLYSPDYLAQPNRPVITGVSSQQWPSGGTASLNVSSANGVASVVLMGLPSVTHGIDTTARRLVLPITANGGGSVTVQVPSINLAPAGHYYVIALDSRGVPSAAKIVQVGSAGGAAAATSVPATAAPQIARTALDPEAPQGD